MDPDHIQGIDKWKLRRLSRHLLYEAEQPNQEEDVTGTCTTWGISLPWIIR